MSAKDMHDMDQLVATARLQAAMLAAYVNELCETHGFTRAEAMNAGLAWAVALVGTLRPPAHGDA